MVSSFEVGEDPRVSSKRAPPREPDGALHMQRGQTPGQTRETGSNPGADGLPKEALATSTLLRWEGFCSRGARRGDGGGIW